MPDRPDALRPPAPFAGLLVACLLAAAAAALSPDAVRAQWPADRTRAGVSLEAAVPVGAFADFVDTGFGVGVSLAHDLTSDGVLGVRLEGGFAQYGSARRAVPFSFTVPQVFLNLDVENQMGHLTVGPQLSAPLGAVRPFVHAGAGFTYLTTRSAVEGTRDRREFASTTHFSDFTLALAAGGGLIVRLSGGDHPLGLLVSATYLRNGEAEYLRNEDLRRLADGDLLVEPVTSDADLVSVRAGVEIGL